MVPKGLVGQLDSNGGCSYYEIGCLIVPDSIVRPVFVNKRLPFIYANCLVFNYCTTDIGRRYNARWAGGDGYVEPAGAQPEHLALRISPYPLHSYAQIFHVMPGRPEPEPLARRTIGSWRVDIYFISPQISLFSEFEHDYVDVWTVAGHTYVVGFQDVYGRKVTEALNQALVEHMELVGP